MQTTNFHDRRLKMRAVLSTVVTIVVSAILGACITINVGDLEDVKKNQEKILAKLDGGGNGPGPGPQGGCNPGGGGPQGAREPDPAKVYAVALADSPARGPSEAWVTIVEWSDFQCPFCARVTDTLQQIEKTYGNDVRLVFKMNPLPFHNRALPAANAAQCANEQGKFWQYHDLLFKNQQALEDSNLEQYTKDAGLDVGRWKRCYADKKFETKIKYEQAAGTGLGASGTPAFFINGRFLSGAQPLPSFQTIIDDELKKAKASGIKKGDYYAKAVIEKGEKSL
jgi:protein-disulfide isomerase